MRLDELKAYEILEKRMIDDLNSEGIVLKHKKTGAKIALLSNDDDNTFLSRRCLFICSVPNVSI